MSLGISGLGSILPSIGRIAGPTVVGAGTALVRGAGAAMRGAISWCRRNPAWCAQAGGTAAIAQMIESGQLPPPRRRRGRGITSRDLRSFRRVAKLINNYCPTVRRLPRAARGKRSCS